MIYEHAYITVDPASRAEFEDAFTSARHLLLDANGGNTAELIRSVDQPGVYLLRVGWNPASDHTEDFASSANGEQFAAAVAHFFTTPPQVVHFESLAL
jgi:heme-degrading monooxygenase HmoA